MQRIITVLLAAAILFSLTVCAASQMQDTAENPQIYEQTERESLKNTEAMSEQNTLQEEPENGNASEKDTLMKIVVQIADRSYSAVLYDNEAGRFMSEQLPYTVRLNKGQIDYCGTTGLDFDGRGFDSQTGHVKGELLYFDGWFVFFLNEQLPLGDEGPMIPFGKLENAADADDMLANAADSADVIISAADPELITTEATVLQLSENPESNQSEEETDNTMKLMIGETEVSVQWEDNESTMALKELAANGPLTIQMSMYGGFEQVGSLGTSLPRNDVQTITSSGDIVLYSGSNVVIFYGSNSWVYTRLGKITGMTDKELQDLLGNGDVKITIALD